MTDNIWESPKSDLEKDEEGNFNCPSCSKPMIIGYLTSSASIDWMDGTEKVKSFSLKRGNRVSAKGITLGDARLMGQRCVDCGISIVTDSD
jgi:hypothetical protein